MRKIGTRPQCLYIHTRLAKLSEKDTFVFVSDCDDIEKLKEKYLIKPNQYKCKFAIQLPCGKIITEVKNV